MWNSSAYELDIWYFVHLDIQGEGEEDPDRRTDNHGKEQKNKFKAVSCPAQTSPPQFIEIWLNLYSKFFIFYKTFLKHTAALETTVFWSHSIRTSRKVALFLSMAWSTFPKIRVWDSNKMKNGFFIITTCPYPWKCYS